MAELRRLAAQFAARPVDPERPPWEALLVLGLQGGGAAYLFKPHHSLSDGVGLLQLLDLSHAHSREHRSVDGAPEPEPRPSESPEGLLIGRLGAQTVNAPVTALRGALAAAGRFVGDPVGTTTAAVGFAMSLRRVLTPPDAPHSPASERSWIRISAGYLRCSARRPQGRGQGRRRVAQRRIPGGSARRGPAVSRSSLVSVDLIPMAIPVSIRTDADPMGSNKFAAARFVAPVGEPDPASAIAAIHEFVAEARSEPALGFLDLIAPVLSRLPDMALTRIAGRDDRTQRPPGVQPGRDHPSAVSGGRRGDPHLPDGSPARYAGHGCDGDVRRQHVASR